MISIKDLANALLKEKSVAIFCHVRPDGDAIGSMLGLKMALNSLGIKADAYCEDQIPARFNYLPKVESISSCIKEEYSALVAVDCAEISRLGSFATFFTKSKNTFNIDHHVSNTRYAKVNYIGDKPSNSENIYDLILALNAEITKEIANVLATGIMTDTGNFNHKGVPSETFLVASKLVERGADLNDISYRMFTAQTKQRARLLSRVMANIRYMLDDRFAVAVILESDFTATNSKRDETEGFVDFVMSVEGVLVGATVMEMSKNIYKISLRSKGPNVNMVAGAFGGGGHVLASGCQIQGELEEVIDRLRYTVSQYIDD